MAEKWNDIKQWDYWYPNYPMCWVCGIRTATQAGHGVLNKGLVRNKKFHSRLNKKPNLVPTCEPCNISKLADTWETRNRMYNKKCDELGQDVVDAWIDSFNLKIPERFIRSPK